MKCLAYCLLSVTGKEYTIDKWGIIDLCDQQQYTCCGKNKKNNKDCEKSAKYHRDSKYWCKIHAKQLEFKMPTNELKPQYINKAKIITLKEICKKYDIVQDKKNIKKTEYQQLIFEELNKNYLSFIPTIKTSQINMVTFGRRMKDGFENLLKHTILDRVIVENQIGPLALRMKTLQGMIMQHFIEKGCLIIEEISAANKLKDYLTKKKTKYAERKKLGIQVTNNIIHQNNNLCQWIPVFINHKKKAHCCELFI